MIAIIRSPQYERDLTEIWDQIGRQDANAVERVLAAIEDTVELLALFPRIGTPCPHLAPGLRRMLWREYLIYYRLRNEVVEIVRVLHGRRNISSRFFE